MKSLDLWKKAIFVPVALLIADFNAIEQGHTY